MKHNTKKITGMAMLCALSICSLYVVRFWIFPAISFMEYDIADVFIFLGTFMYGPISGLIMTLVVSLYQAFLMGGNGLVGAIMHFLATGVFSLVAGFIYSKNRNIKGAILSLVIGFIVWVIVMLLADLLIIPPFMGVTIDFVISLVPLILAFNAIKAGANSILTFLLYKRVHKLFDVLGIADRKQTKAKIEVDVGIYYTNSAKETEDIAKAFGKKLALGDTVLLDGNLGAGKTVFARGIARSMGIKEDVLSPTFNILKEYDGGRFRHFDMYRIEDEDELENLGFEEYFNSDSICVVEWNRMPNIKGTIYKVEITNLDGKKKRKIEITNGESAK